MNRMEIEIELHRGRADSLEWIAALTEDELTKPRTQSEHDPDSWWNAADHFIHTTLIEKNFNEMVRRHISGGQGMDTNIVDPSGKTKRSVEDVMAYVHRFTEEWKVEQHGKPLDELVKIGLAVRSDTLQLAVGADRRTARVRRFRVRRGATAPWAACWPSMRRITGCIDTGPRKPTAPCPSTRTDARGGHHRSPAARDHRAAGPDSRRW